MLIWHDVVLESTTIHTVQYGYVRMRIFTKNSETKSERSL